MSSQVTRDRENLEAKETTLFDLFFRDREGNLVIAQAPNLPSLVGLTAGLLQFVIPQGNLHTASSLIAFGALFTWAWQELFDGVNYFRRSLGFVSLAGLIVLGLNSR